MICIVLLLSSGVSAQIDNGIDFLNYALMSEREKLSRTGDFNGWKGLGVDQYSMDGRITSEMKYLKNHNNEKYMLTLMTVLDGNTGATYHITKIVMSNEIIFNNWMKELRSIGIIIKKVPDSNNRWIAAQEDNFSITLEKRKIKDIWLYEISVLN